MTTITLDRIVELWPHLSDEAREKLVEIAEENAGGSLQLTPEEERLIEQSREDFRQGRSVSLSEWRAELDTFVANYKVGANST